MRTYLFVTGVLGAMAMWASENFFWSAPAADLSWAEAALTWLAYSLCVACALAAVLVSGARGWVAVFLGGAITGWLIEGVIVGTMYIAFPFQIVWTPLAWHALVSGLAVVGLGRVAGRWSWWRALAAWTGVGLFGGVFALYWPVERSDLPGFWVTAAYLCGAGMVVPLGNVALDRIGTLERPRSRWLWVAPGILATLWLLRVALAFSPFYLALPAVLGLTWWIMRRVSETDTPLDLGVSAPIARHLLFLAAPITATVIATVGWGALPAGWPGNVVAVLITAPVSLGLLGWLWWRAFRRRTDPRSRRRTSSTDASGATSTSP